MKKWLPWAALALCALSLAGIIFGLLRFVGLFNRSEDGKAQKEPISVEEYFKTTWQGFSLTEYDSETQRVTLQKELDVTYEQACSFGKDCYEEMALGHIDTMQTMKYGCAVSCGAELKTLTVNGISSDGKEIYTVSDDGSLTACWEDQP